MPQNDEPTLVERGIRPRDDPTQYVRLVLTRLYNVEKSNRRSEKDASPIHAPEAILRRYAIVTWLSTEYIARSFVFLISNVTSFAMLMRSSSLQPRGHGGVGRARKFVGSPRDYQPASGIEGFGLGRQGLPNPAVEVCSNLV